MQLLVMSPVMVATLYSIYTRFQYTSNVTYTLSIVFLAELRSTCTDMLEINQKCINILIKVSTFCYPKGMLKQHF